MNNLKYSILCKSHKSPRKLNHYQKFNDWYSVYKEGTSQILQSYPRYTKLLAWENIIIKKSRIGVWLWRTRK